MRRLLALVAAAIIVVGCSGQSTADPYEVVNQSTQASYDLVQVNVGLTGTLTGTSITIDPQAIQLIVDSKAGKVAFKIELPLASLGADATALRGLGVTGDTLDVELVYDGAGEDGRPFVPGLIDAAALGTPTTAEVAGVKSELAGALRADRGPVTGGSRGAKNAPSTRAVTASSKNAAKQAKTHCAGDGGENAVVPLAAASRAA